MVFNCRLELQAPRSREAEPGPLSCDRYRTQKFVVSEPDHTGTIGAPPTDVKIYEVPFGTGYYSSG